MSPYTLMFSRLRLPLKICTVTCILLLVSSWLHTPILSLIMSIIAILSWGWVLIRAWRYRPSSGENVALITNYKMAVILMAVLAMFVCALLVCFIQFGKPPLFFVWIVSIVMMLCLLGVVILALRSFFPRKTGRSVLH
jgi:hypothetical protein